MGKPPVHDDIDELLSKPERPAAKECHVCWALSRLEPGDRDRLVVALARPDISANRIRPLFAARLNGWAPGDTTMQRHRNGGCAAS